MIANSFPRTQGALSRETYLTLLLLAIVEQVGGEVRIFPEFLEKPDAGGKITIDWDTSAQPLVIRGGSPGMIVAEVRGSGWTTPPKQVGQTEQAPPASHRVMTEE